MKLTIGMASTNDFDGTYFTIQHLRMHHRASEFEIIVVDNAPGGPHHEMLKSLTASTGIKHVQFGNPNGTSPSRNKIFDEANGEWVLVIDSHILLRPKTVDTLLDSLNHKHWLSNPEYPIEVRNLYTGPMWYDDLRNFTTHFNVKWREEMLGVWGRAWRCSCSTEGLAFSLWEKLEEHKTSDGIAHRLVTEAVALSDGKTPVKFCYQCKRPIPILDWSGHESAFISDGYYSLGMKDTDPPFIIPANGLGLFLSHRDHWLGFHKDARGFGGEEVCVHDLYRQNGRQTICLPFLKWLHKFGRPFGVQYPLLRYHKARNYVLWYQLLGKPLDEVHQHFVESGRLPVQEWEYLLENPASHKNPPVQSGCNSCSQPEAVVGTLDEALAFVRSKPRDLNQHVDRLKELGDQVETVTSLSIRREAMIAFAASAAKQVRSYCTEVDSLTDTILKLREGVKHISGDPSQVAEIEPTDLLFLNTKHTGSQITLELERHHTKVARYIVLHNTVVYGETGEDGQAGIMSAVRQFMRTNPQWSVVSHTSEQYGLTVLSCNPDDKPKPPSIMKQGINFSQALAKHVTSGAGKVLLVVYESRLNTCMPCDQRTGDDGLQCAACGCNIEVKASWPSSECPLGRWSQ